MIAVCIRPAQIFLGFPPLSPRWSLGQNVPGNQFSANSEVVWPRHGGTEGPRVELILTHSGDLQSLCDVVKRLPNLLKIGFQARFCPNFTVELEAEIPPKIGLAYCIVIVTVFAFNFKSVGPEVPCIYNLFKWPFSRHQICAKSLIGVVYDESAYAPKNCTAVKKLKRLLNLIH